LTSKSKLAFGEGVFVRVQFHRKSGQQIQTHAHLIQIFLRLSTLCHTVCCRLTIGNGRGSGFVNDSQNVHSGDGAGILGGLTLGIVEVCWHRDLGKPNQSTIDDDERSL